jgi:hypothetical protein
MSDEPRAGDDGEQRGLSKAQKQFIGFILVIAVVNVAYRLVYASGFSQTAALYVGIPVLLAIGLALLPRSQSATGMLLKGSMLALLIACVVLPEGLICLIFVVPLVALIAVIVGGAIDWARSRDRKQGPTLMAVTLPLLLLSLEGLVGTPFTNHDSVTASITVHASPAAVEGSLATTPRFDRALPPFLAVGFNRPVAATGSGVQIGDQRTIDFTGGTHDDHPLRLFGLTGERSVDHHAHMLLTVSESGPGRLVFTVDNDMTMLARWADLERAVVTWERVDDSTTKVSWRLEYVRRIYPTAYFAPLQRYGMDQAAGYLLDAVVKDRLP